MGKMGRLMR